jgi:hypothetical protein
LSNIQLSFKYPTNWTTIDGPSGKGPNDFAVATSPAFTSSSMTTADNPGAQVNLILQLSNDSDTIGCDENQCKVSSITPLNNLQMPNAVLVLVNETSNNGTNFTQYVVANSNSKVGDTSITADRSGSNSVYVFGQPYYYLSPNTISETTEITDPPVL